MRQNRFTQHQTPFCRFRHPTWAGLAPVRRRVARRVADRLASRGRGGAQAGRPRLALDIQLIEISAELKYFDALKNPILNIATITSALGIGAGVIGSVLYAGYISEQRDIMINADNQNITPTQRSFLLNEIDLITVNSINSFNSNVSNLSISQGFVNCNFTTAQTIPSISTNSIIYNGTESSNTTSFANYLKLSGGIMSGQITGISTLNATTGIFGNI